MSVFSITITTALNNYKAILRRNLPAEKASVKISKLKLGRKHIQNASDVGLFNKATRVIECIRNTLQAKDQSPLMYMGLEDFMHYLKDVMSEYYISGDRVIHGTQNASRAIVEAIQLVGLPPERLDGDVKKKLEQCVHEVASYGTDAQYDMLHRVFEKYLKANIKFFEPLLLDLRRISSSFA